MDVTSMISTATTMTVEYLPKILLAILTLMIGLWIIGKIVRFVSDRMKKSDMDVSLAGFLSSLLGIGLKIMLLFSVAEIVGVKTTSFVAIFGALMVGIGMALNGSIGHLASGVMLMIFKPFKAGDLVEIGGGHMGTVEAINAFNTTLATLDNKRIIVANGNVTGNTITNISGQGDVGVELTFGIGYGDDIDKAKQIILEVGERCPYILKAPAQGVVVAELADSSVNLATRPFCKSENYWDARFYMIENVKKEFDKNNIGIPYQTLDINMVSSN